MRRTLLTHLVSTGVLLCSIALAQNPNQNPGAIPPGQPGQTATTPSTFPGDNSQMGGTPAPVAMERMDDQRFVKAAALHNMVAAELGKLAAQKATRDDIKQFGRKMAEDSIRSNDQLKQIAGRANLQIPDAIDTKHQARIDKLSKLSGEEFDKAYLKEQVKEQQSQARDFSDEAQGGTDPAVKAFANSNLSSLQQNVQLARNLNK